MTVTPVRTPRGAHWDAVKPERITTDGDDKMAWTIRRAPERGDHPDNNWIAEEDGTARARIMFVKGVWVVTFPDASALNWHCATSEHGLDRCIGYVRGIERAATVHAKESRVSDRMSSIGRASR